MTRLLVALLLAAFAATPPATVRDAIRPAEPQAQNLVVRFRANTEDDASAGQVTVPMRVGEPARALVWESRCRLDGIPDASDPDRATDQYWTFEAVRDRAGPSGRVQLRYRAVVPGAAKPSPERRHTFPPGSAAPLVLNELSARRDCRYDRLTISVALR